ncbi:flagellar export protein FliJ [Pectinatus haikarae]|uniref:Flagellar FliJ protein n=1 Tax=Pectinatus haikarae TaxID=349096 RepID=A0ABT9Y7G8_9FIRM|nr:flagellar export protein FliJ [Pectinatus haikarae]MDQ0203780.1 flagellar FliJ protein [Pectinatus haikarae]
MEKFIFKLEAFLKISVIEREKAEISMAAAVQNLQKQKKILISLKLEMDLNLKEYEKLLAEEKVNVSMMQMYGNFFSWKRGQINLQETSVRNAVSQRKQCLQVLLAAQKKVKSLEQLREKRFDEYRYEVFAQEQKQIDEIGLQMHTRRIGMEE